MRSATFCGAGGCLTKSSSTTPHRVRLARDVNTSQILRIFIRSLTTKPRLKPAVLSLATFKGDELEAARLRTAWGVTRPQLAKAFENARQGGQGAESTDLDAPLSTSEERERSQTFAEAYSCWGF